MSDVPTTTNALTLTTLSPSNTAPPAGSAGGAEALDVAGFLGHLQHERRLSGNTLAAYGLALRQFAEWAQSGGLACPLRPESRELGGFLEHLRDQGLSASSIRQKLAAVRTCYRYLHVQGRISTKTLGVVLGTEGPAAWQRLPAVLGAEQAARLVQAPLPSDRYHLRDRGILEFLYASGCRVSELCDLTLTDLRLSDRYAEVLGKGNKPRLVLLGRPAVAALDAYLGELRPRMVRLAPESPWLFVSRAGRRLTCEMVWTLVKRYARRMGLEGVSPHVFRHSCATALMNGGAGLQTVSNLLGHASINATQRYLHVDEERKRELHRLYHPLGTTPSETATVLPDAA